EVGKLLVLGIFLGLGLGGLGAGVMGHSPDCSHTDQSNTTSSSHHGSSPSGIRDQAEAVAASSSSLTAASSSGLMVWRAMRKPPAPARASLSFSAQRCSKSTISAEVL